MPQRTCVASSSQNGNGQPETVTYRNETQAAETVFVIVDSPQATGAGAFSLLATLGN